MNKILLVIIVFLGLFSQKASASHYAAADIYYDYLGPNYYKVHLIVYRDCSGVGMPTTATVCAKSWTCNLQFNVPMDTVGANDPLNGTYVDQLCPNVSSICQGGTLPGYQYFHYVGTTLGIMNNACTDWHFIFGNFARNNAINNLTNPAGAGMNVFCTLDNVNHPTNNSVRLLAMPIPYVCANSLTIFQNLPFDPDGDSLYFYPSTPLDQGANCDTGTNLLYSGTYTFQNPLPTNVNGYVVDPVLGTATFTPTGTGNFVLAFRCDEYDVATNTRRGRVLRDVQIAVLNCAAPPPAPIFNTNVVGGSVVSTNPPHVTVCPGTPLTIYAYGVSQSGSNSLFAYSNNLQISPNTTFVANPPNGGNDTVYTTFTWTPTTADSGNHILLITFADSTCTNTQPIVLKSYLTILIDVLPGVTGGGPYTYCIDGPPTQLQAAGPGGITNWEWTDINGNSSGIFLNNPFIFNPTAQPQSTMQYIVTGLPAVAGCTNKDTVEVFVYPKTIVDAGPNKTICANESVVINASVSAAGTANWLPNYSISSTTALTPTVNPLVDTTYVLTYTDNNNCKFKDSMRVDVNGIKASLSPLKSTDSICPGIPFQLFANANAQPCAISQTNCSGIVDSLSVGTATSIFSGNNSPFFENLTNGARIQYLYKANELKAAGVKPGNIKKLGFNVTSKATGPLANFSINMLCTNLSQLDATTGLVGGTNNVYYKSNYNSIVGLNMFNLKGDGYFWDGVQNLIIELCYTPIQGNTNQGDVVEQCNYTYIGSMMQNASNVQSCNLTFNFPTPGSLSPAKPKLTVLNCKAGDFNYAWNPASAFDSSTVENPYSSNGVANSTVFTVTAISTVNSNCTNTGTVSIYIDKDSKIDAFATPNILCEPGVVSLSSLVTGMVPKYDCGEENVPCIANQNNYTITSVGASVSSISPYQASAKMGRCQMLYTAAELNAAGIVAGNINNIGFNIAQVNSNFAPYRNFYIKMGCVNATLNSLNNYVDYFKLKEVYYNPNLYILNPGWQNLALNTPFLWNGTSNLIIDICWDNSNNNVNINDDITVIPTATVQYLTDVVSTGSTNLCEYPYKGQSGVGYQNNFKPELFIGHCAVKPKTFDYVWKPQYLIYDSSAQNTTAYVNQTTTYTVSTITGSKCPVSDTVNVTLLQHDLLLSVYDTSVCLGDAFQVYAYGFGTSTNATYDWSPTVGLSCSNCPNPVIQPVATTTYTCVRTDSYGCKDTQQVIIRINQNPIVDIYNSYTGLADSATINYGESINLTASGTNLVMFIWSPVWGISNPNFYTTIASPAEPTLYYVYAKDSFGCRAMDSVYINLNYRDSITVPNAFSPNGDGKNDMFQIVNIKNKSIQEFRVFNRWGQEVFTSSKNNIGWDGTCKGKRCDVGTYHYYIKVAYADGYIKVLKGDVTLLN